MKVGDRVSTPLGAGEVVWVRMHPPKYITPIACSVVLDSRRGSPGYTGTAFPAADVKPEVL